MKRILLTTTAVAGLLALAAPSAMAQDAAGKMRLTLGGYSAIQYGFWSNKAKSTTGREFRNDTEVQVRGDAKADNGLQYGVHIEIESTGNNGASALDYDEAGIYIAGSFGKFQLGDEDGASDEMAVYAPAVGIGQLDGDYDFFSSNGCGTNCNLGSGTSVTFFKVPDSSDSTKVTYYTPTFWGLQAGISYAPERDQGDSVVVANNFNNGTINTTNRLTDWVEGGVLYKNTFSGIGIKLGGTFAGASAAPNALVNPLVQRKSFIAYQFGGQVSYAGFTLGGSYVDQGGVTLGGGLVTSSIGTQVVSVAPASTASPTSTTADSRRWSAQQSFQVGATYEIGPVGVGIQYGLLDTNKGDIDAIALGVNYTVAPGLLVGADYVHWTNDAVRVNSSATSIGKKDEGDTFLLQTRVNF